MRSYTLGYHFEGSNCPGLWNLGGTWAGVLTPALAYFLSLFISISTRDSHGRRRGTLGGREGKARGHKGSLQTPLWFL